jgi:hypothetical protein
MNKLERSIGAILPAAAFVALVLGVVWMGGRMVDGQKAAPAPPVAPKVEPTPPCPPDRPWGPRGASVDAVKALFQRLDTALLAREEKLSDEHTECREENARLKERVRELERRLGIEANDE